MKQALVWLLGLCLLFTAASCADAHGKKVTRADGALELSFDLATEVPLVADHFQIVGLDKDGKVIFGPSYQPKSAAVKLTGVPIGVVRVEVTYLIGTTPIGMVSAGVDLSPGSAQVDFSAMMPTDVERLQQLTISPTSAEIAVRGVQDFHVSGLFSDGASYDLTTLVAWLSSAPAVATVDAGGRVTGVAAGTANISASLAGVSSNSAQLTVTAPADPTLLPTIASVTPSEGSDSGGTVVTIAGTHLLGATAVSFGTTPASSFEVDSDTQIVATSPAGMAGIVNVQVSTPKGSSTASDAGRFTYFALPVVQTLAPLAGKQAGGETIVITGRNFTGVTSVTFGGNAAAAFTVDSSTQITATAPSGVGIVDVLVANGKGSSSAHTTARYRYLPIPILSSVDPGNGPEAGGNPVVLRGSNFAEVTAVMFGGTLADFAIVSNTELTATAPAGSGTVRVTLRTPGGTSEGLDYAYLPIPALTELDPLAGPEAGGNTVKLFGSGFTSVTGVMFGEVAATSFNAVSDTELEAVAPAGTGTARVTVVTSGGISNSLDYRYAAQPTVGSASATVGPLAGGNPITLQGSGFAGATAVRFGSSAASSFVVVSDTELTVVAPAGSTGTVAITVVTPGGVSAPISYQYAPIPALTSVAPARGALPGGEQVTLVGSGFDGATAVNFGELPASSFSVFSNTQITATVPAGTGAIAVTVVTPGGVSNTFTYTYLAAPTLDEVVPAQGPLQGGNPVRLTGSHFTSASEVRFGALAAPSFTIASDTQIDATPPVGTGSVMVTVTTPGGVSNEQTYDYVPGPALVGLAPAEGPEAGGTTVTLSGGDFTGTTEVSFGSTPATSFTVVSAGQIDAIAPAGTGPVDVTVTNAGGTSNTLAFTYVPRPEIDALTPAGGRSVGGTYVTITGVHLSGANEVHFGTIPATSFSVVSDNEIVAIAGPGTGVVEVSVRTAGGTSEVLPYTYTTILPVIAALAPTSGPLAGGNSVTILGSGFTDATTVTFGTSPSAFTFVSDTEITTTAPAGSGVLNVVVTTPSGVSNPFPYAYVAPPVLASAFPSSGLEAGGASVVLLGAGLTGTTAVSFGSASAVQFTVDSDTQVTAVAPPGTGSVSVTLATPGGTSNTLSFSYFPPTAITSVTPDAGPASGSTLVTIQGVSFTDVSTVLFGSMPATFTVLSDTQIEAIAPAGIGAVSITVLGPAGVASSAYTYLPPPLLTSLTPAAGPASGGNTVTVSGTGLSLATQVFFGSTPAQFSVVSDAELSVLAPAGAGTVDLTVTSTGGTATVVGAYSYVQAPTVSAVSPSQGPVSGGTSVAITGTDLATVSAVSFGGVPASLQSVTPTSIQVTAPAGSAGSVDVVVTTIGGSATAVDAFSYVAPPVLTSLAPSAGPITGGNTVTLSGSELGTTSAVSFEGVPASIASISGTTVTVIVPAHAPASASVVVTTAGGESNALPYQYVAVPTIGGASPNAGPTAGGTVVTLAGSGFSDATSVTFGGVPATSFTVDSDTQITATAPANTSLTQIVVTTAGGDSNGVSFNYVAPPAIVAISPTSGPQIGGIAVTLVGSGFAQTTSVTFGGAPAAFAAITDSQLIATVPAGIGIVDVVVSSVGGSATAIAGYRYVGSATLASITPDIGSVAGGNSVVISGVDLLDVVAVSFGNAAATITAATPTSLTVTVPAGAAGATSVVATTVSGPSNGLAYTYVAPPTLDTVTPSAGAEAGGNTVLLDGEALDLVTAVTFGGVDASFSVVSDQQLSVQVPAGTGLVDVTVTNLAGSDSLVGGYEYVPGPTLSAISPAVGAQAGGTTVTLTGTNLLATDSVLFGGTPATSFTAVSPTSVIAVSPAGTGSVDVTLSSAGGSATLVGAFTYAGTPAITSLSPTAGPAGGGNTLTITGTDLASATSAHFLGFGVVPVATASATQVTVVAPGLTGGATYNVSVLTAGGESNTLPYDSVTPPLISVVTPSAGPVAGGTSVTLVGTGFTGTTQVTFDGVPATSFTVDHAGQITAVAPAGAAGAVDVEVVNPGGSSTASDGFTYAPAPGLGSLSATGGTVAGGETLTLTGTNFAGATQVLFGSVPAPSFTVISPTQIVVTTPASVSGGVSVAVITPGGTSNALSWDYVDPPVIIQVSPESGPVAGGNTITLEGLALETTNSVLIGGATATFTVVDDEELTVVVPAGSAGPADVQVQTLAGTATAVGGYEYVPAPSLSGLSPAVGGQAGGTSVTLTGTNLLATESVSFGGTPATSFTAVSPTSVIAASPAGTGIVDVTLSSPGGSATLVGAFTYAGTPTITSLSPSAGPAGGGNTLTITGTELDSAAGVHFLGFGVMPVATASATQVTVVAPGLTGGATYNVSVLTAGGESNTLPYDSVTPPLISVVTPSAGPVAGGTSVTLVGTGFTGTTQVTFDGVPATSFTVDHAGQITAVAPAGAAGAVDVEVVNPGGSSTASDGFTYAPAPGLGSLSATGGTVAGGETVTLTGTNFTGATQVLFGGVAASSFSVISPTQIVAVTPVSVSGGVNVVVATPGGSSNALSFAYVDPPVINSITPSSGPLAGGNVITIEGLALETTYGVLIDGVTATFTVVDDEELTVTVPAGNQGYVDVEVQTLGGSATATSAYNYVPASDFVFSPNMGREAGGDLMTLNGVYLAGVSDVKFGNTSATFQVISPVTLNVTTPPGTGVVDVTVTTPGGSTTKSAAFTYEPIPTISSVSPNEGPTAGGLQVTITGTGLTNALQVAFGNNLATPSSATSTQVTVVVPAGVSAGAVNVVVSTPGGDSNALPFTYFDSPVLFSVSPSSGSTAGGGTVILTGQGLTGTSDVTFDGVPASFTFVSDGQLDVVAPAGNLGSVDIVVTNPGGSATAVGAYTYATPPALGALVPNTGAVAGGTAVTALGTDLSSVTDVSVGGTPVAFTVVTPTQLVFTTPANSGPGPVTVTATNAGGTSNGLTFTYVTPVSLVDIEPSAGPEAGGNSVVFDGDDFTTVQRVIFDGNDASFTVDTDEQLTATAPAGFGTVDVVIVSAAGSETFAGAYTYVPPAVFTVLPFVGRESGGETITLSGSNLLPATDVLFGSTPATSFTVDSDSQITVVTPAGTGATDVTVVTPGGSITEPGGFIFVPPPVTTSLSDVIGPSAGGNTLTITGSNLDTTTTVLFNGVPGNVSSATSTQVAVIVPASSPTTVTVEVITAGGSASNLSYEYVDPPSIISVSPTDGATAGGTTVTLSGSSFSSTTAVYFDGTPATSFTVVMDTQLTAVAPAGATGTVDIVVQNPGGSATAVGAFTYRAAPTLSGIAPTYGPVSGGSSISLGGSNFVPGATSVSFGGVASAGVSVLSPTLLSAALPAHAAGPVSVTVTTPGGTSSSITFNYVEAPTITSISPNSGDWNGDYFATVTGTNLTSFTAIYFGIANPGYNITVLSDTQVQVMVPSSGILGPVDVTVETEGGSATAVGAFTFTP